MENKALNLPSKKLFYIFIPVIVVLGVFVMVKGKGSDSNIKSIAGNNAAKVVSIQNTIINTVDTDGDGVPDWLEVIWHTDPNKTETFGTPDKDYIEKQVAAGTSASGTTYTSITNTDDLSKELFTRYISLQQSGELNSATVDSMAADIVSKISIKPGNEVYTNKDISTFPDSNLNLLQTYVASLTNLYNQYADSYLKQNPNFSLTPEDPAFAQNAKNLGDYYVKFSRALLAIPVPAGGAALHLAYVNSIAACGAGLQAIGNMNNEPLSGIFGLKNYLDAEDTQNAAIANLRNYLIGNGIVNVTLNPF